MSSTNETPNNASGNRSPGELLSKLTQLQALLQDLDSGSFKNINRCLKRRRNNGIFKQTRGPAMAVFAAQGFNSDGTRIRGQVEVILDYDTSDKSSRVVPVVIKYVRLENIEDKFLGSIDATAFSDPLRFRTVIRTQTKLLITACIGTNQDTIGQTRSIAGPDDVHTYVRVKCVSAQLCPPGTMPAQQGQ